MLKAIRLKETTAEQVMLPREQVVGPLARQAAGGEHVHRPEIGLQPAPLLRRHADQVLGVIHVKELLWQHQALGDQTSLAAIVRPILTFMAKTRLPAMLELFRRSRNHLAVVLDRDETLVGLVSFEDVLEELVGDIRDEFDIEKGPFFERSAESVLVDADLPLRDLAGETGWPFPTQTTETVEKWALRQWGRVPPAGGQLEIEGGFILTASEVGARRIRRLRVTRRPVPIPEGAEAEEEEEEEARRLDSPLLKTLSSRAGRRIESIPWVADARRASVLFLRRTACGGYLDDQSQKADFKSGYSVYTPSAMNSGPPSRRPRHDHHRRGPAPPRAPGRARRCRGGPRRRPPRREGSRWEKIEAAPAPAPPARAG